MFTVPIPKNHARAIQFLSNRMVLRRPGGERTLWTDAERELALAVAETLPCSSHLRCEACAERDVSRQAVIGFTFCRGHLRQLLEFRIDAELSPPPPFSEVVRWRHDTPDRFRVPREAMARYLAAFLSRKLGGMPTSAEERSHAHLVVDALPHMVIVKDDPEAALKQCAVCRDLSGHEPSPALEGFSKCRRHLHEEIDEPSRTL